MVMSGMEYVAGMGLNEVDEALLVLVLIKCGTVYCF